MRIIHGSLLASKVSLAAIAERHTLAVGSIAICISSMGATILYGRGLWYDNRSKGYRLCTNGKNIIISRTVKFLDKKYQK